MRKILLPALKRKIIKNHNTTGHKTPKPMLTQEDRINLELMKKIFHRRENYINIPWEAGLEKNVAVENGKK